MKYPNQYSGKNPIPGPKRFGNQKDAAAPGATPVVVVDPPANDPAGAVVITSIAAKVEAGPDANVVIAPKPVADCDNAKPLASAEAKVDALENVKSGEQILADSKAPTGSSRPKS